MVDDAEAPHATYPGRMDAFACSRHPDTETYLRCSACETPICPGCWVEAAVGYQCPDCAAARGTAVPAQAPSRSRLLGGAGAEGDSRPPDGQLSATLGARAAVVGLVAAAVGGMLLGPVLSQGTLFLLSSGALGWVVARAVYWAADEVSTPLVRAMAITFATLTAAVGMITSGTGDAEAGLLFLAYPAAMYGGWIVVRRR